MKVLHALIAYMPARHKLAEEVTREAVAAGAALGYPMVVWHGGNKPTPGSLCPEIHEALSPPGWKGEIVDYENGNLSDNWCRAWDDLFEAGADWVLWTSNDVIWNEKAREAIDDLLSRADDNTVYALSPFVFGLIPRKLYYKVRPHWDVDWEASMHDDSNFLATVLWQGGKVVLNALPWCLRHTSRITEVTYCSDGLPRQERSAAAFSNHAKFKKRWRISPHSWPVPQVTHRLEPTDVPPPPPYEPRRYSKCI